MKFSHWSLVWNQRSCKRADLFPVQRGGDTDFSTTGVDGELLQRISTDDGVTQQTVDRPILVGGRYLQGEDVSGNYSIMFLRSHKHVGQRPKNKDPPVRSEVTGQGGCFGDPEEPQG